MRLPAADRVVVPREKITDYLLARDHPDGHSKAAFFSRFGFSAPAWERLAEALEQHAARHDVATMSESPFGVRYTVEGELECPDGRAAWLRTVWILEHGDQAPRLVTAYPCVRGENDEGA